MKVQRTLLASAIFAAFAPATSFAQAPAEPPVPKVIVTATPFSGAEAEQILTPAKILAGDELRDKLGASLGETLANELGVTASSFGAGASRPIIRGLEGSRVKVMENGMAVSDVSGLSNDHAVSSDGATARQIEILRGPAALLYGSGAIGGLVNVVNERIPAALEDHVGGQAEARYSSVDRGKNVSASVDGAAGDVGFHVDGNWREADDYKIPGSRAAGEPRPANGRLAASSTRQDTFGLGASYIRDWGHVGMSAATLNNLYGIPSLEGSRIDQNQRRYDVDTLVKQGLGPAIEQLRFKAGYTDYDHAELNDEGAPEVIFANRALETRTELAHASLSGWRGVFGLQTENTHFSALNDEGGPDTVPVTHSRTYALFLVEERDFGPLRVNAGARLEKVTRTPVSAIERKFDLQSYSVGGQWRFAPGLAAVGTLSVAQRAPATEELYSGGPHDATQTFDIGNADFKKETSRNLELSLQKTEGLVRWKANLFVNKVKDFIYGNIHPELVDEAGEVIEAGAEEALRLRTYQQADATIRGAEAEIGYNQQGLGWSARAFADTSRGKLDDVGNLPLQPATRYGVEGGYRSDALRAGVSLVQTRNQDRLARFETTPTPSHTQLNASLSWHTHLGNSHVTYFLLAKNLLNEEIRVATSVLKDVAPLPGRNLVFGVRTRF